MTKNGFILILTFLGLWACGSAGPGVLVNEARCAATEGYIGLQSEGGAMDVRNIRIR